MVARTLSKSYALAGLRFGYLVAQPQVIRELCKVKDSYNCDSLSIAGATVAIDDQAWLAETRGHDPRHTRPDDGKHFARSALMSSIRRPTLCGVRTRAMSVEPVYRELKQAGVLVRYMLYPGWGDGCGSPSARTSKWMRALRSCEQWFEIRVASDRAAC